MVTYGADPAALDALAHQLMRASATLDQINAQLSARVRYARWNGPQAAHFRGQWTRVYSPALRAAHYDLEHAADQLRANARDQRAASAAGGGATSVATMTFHGDAPRSGDSVLDALIHDFFFKVVPPSMDLGAEVLGGVAGGFLSVGGLLFAGYDLYHDINTPGNFQDVHIFGDELELAGAAIGVVALPFLVPPASPIGVGLMGAGLVVGGVGLGINMTVDFWDEGGGREIWHTVQPWATHEVSEAAHAAWNTAYSVTSHAASVVDHGAEAVGDAASSVWHAATGWL